MPRTCFRTLVWLFMLLATGMSASARAELDRNQVRFRTIGIHQGLSSSTARAMVQDPTGHIWIATQDGLNRFDGYSFAVFATDPDDPQSISADHITALAAEGERNVWVGTVSRGLNLLNLETGRFERFLSRPNGPLLGNQVSDLMVDRQGGLWVATLDGGLQFKARSAASFETRLGSQACTRRIRDLLELSDGDLLIACDSELLLLDTASGAVTHWPAETETGWPKDLQPTALARMPDGRLIVGDIRQGLLELSPDGRLQRWHRHQSSRPDSLVDDQVITLLITSTGELWVGTYSGLSHHLGGESFLNFRHDTADAASIPANRIPALFEDRDGLIWIGTWTAGIAVHNPATRGLRMVRNRQSDPNSLPHNPVRALLRDHDNSLWLGVSEGGGLVHLSDDLKVLRRYVHDPADPRSLPDNSVQAILRRRNGELWLTTAIGGVARMSDDGKGFIRLPRNQQGIPTTGARALLEARDQTLWIGTDDAGVFYRCADCATYRNIRHDPDHPELGFAGNAVNSIFQDRKGQIWVAFNGFGVARVDPGTGAVERFRYVEGDQRSLPSDAATSFAEAVNGDLWVGTQGGGIARIEDLGQGRLRFHSVGKRDGLSANAIGSIIDDGTGKLWIATIVGIDEFNPRTGQVRNLSASDGFDRSGYFINARAVDDDGNIYFGGLLGLVKFHPRDFRPSPIKPMVTFTDVQAYGGETSLQARQARHQAAFLNVLEFDHAETVWTVSFSTMNFFATENTRFSYRLLGLSEEWVQLPRGQHHATFTQVPPGDYELQVKAALGDGQEPGPVRKLRVTVRPGIWRSPWAWFGYIAIGSLVILFSAWRIRRNMRERAEHQAVIVENERLLKLSLWGSRDELWDYDVSRQIIRRDNPLPGMFPPDLDRPATLSQFTSTVHPDDARVLHRAINEHIQGQSEFYEASFRARNLRGDWVWLLQRGQAVARDAEGVAVRIVGTTRDITSVKQVEEALRQANEQLEARVSERTQALTHTNQELRATLDKLTQTQSQLIESEKLASLGSLVAGVAHEINTPLGICITAASHLEQSTRQLQERSAQNVMTRTDLQRFEDTAIESARLIMKNLERAAHLVRSFKQVAVDQGSEQRRSINLAEYLNEIVFALKPLLKRTTHRLDIDCPPDVVIDTYPGALYQIVVNFVNNSLVHAFPDGRSGQLSVSVSRIDSDHLRFDYADNGIGVGVDVQRRIFEPFFTTKRGQGGSGLGLHIVYNLVTKLLNGSITVSSGNGLRFRIVLPIQAP